MLSRLIDRHKKWPFGGLAELCHNSKDAGASTIRIERFPNPDAKEEQKDFALKITDDGSGMGHKAMVEMMRIGADKGIGAIEGKIGGYGVGFKAGSLATAHTAVVVSRSEKHSTISIGLLSNEPYVPPPFP